MSKTTLRVREPNSTPCMWRLEHLLGELRPGDDDQVALAVEGRPGRRTDDELVTLFTEFLNGGTDTTAYGLEWAIARLIMDPTAQDRLAAEVQSVTDGRPVEDADAERLQYVNAFVKELLRRHPPLHFTVTHLVSEPMKLAGYDIPAGTAINFYTAAIAEDPPVWDSPEKFMPERFMGGCDDVDMTRVRNIKMMPFEANMEKT